MTCYRNYPTDLKGHWLLPRWWIFQQVVSVFESNKRSVPVFNGEPRRHHHDVTTDTALCPDRPRGRIIMIVRIALVKMGSKNRGINYTLIIPGSLTQSCLMKTWLSPILRLRLGLGLRVRAWHSHADKHLSYSWPDAKWMFDKSRELGFPLTGGSSIPFYYRKPEIEVSSILL